MSRNRRSTEVPCSNVPASVTPYRSAAKVPSSSLSTSRSWAGVLTYVWTPAQLRDVLGDEDGTFAADLYGVTDAGTFEHGTSVLRLFRDIDDASDKPRHRWA